MPGRAFSLRLIAIVASGLMVAVLLPPYNIAMLAWLCLVPMLIAVWSLNGRHRGKKGFLIGFLAGAIAFGIQLTWLGVVSWVGAVVLPLYLAIYFGLFGAYAATLGNPWNQKAGVLETPLRSLFTALTHAAVWGGLEWFRGWFLTGFGWNGLGVAFHQTLAISQAADLLGVTGLSMMLVFFQAVLVQVGHRVMKTGADGIRRPRWDFGVTALGVGLLLAYGLLRIASESGKESLVLKSLLVQINIPQDAAHVLWTAEEVHMAYEEETIEGLREITDNDQKRLKAAIKESPEGGIELSSPDWVIWPETALTGRLIRTEDGTWGAWRQNMETISRIRKAGGSFDLIYGVVEIEGESRENEVFQKEDPHIYNSIVVQSADDDLLTFRKHHLVMFGETIPFVDTIPFLREIYEQQAGVEFSGSFTPGPSLVPLPVQVRGTEVQMIPSVCFEDTVPRLTRKFVRPAPQVIVNLTNDGWFKETAAAAQHFANARFRTIELRRPMLRCANSGVSAAVDTIGTTVHPQTGKQQIIEDENGSTFVRDSLLTELEIPLRPSRSLYVLIGDWGVIGISIIGLVSAIAYRRLGIASTATMKPQPARLK